ncbi:MAG: hypothetical protein ACK4TN_04500, partial [Brevinematales bacterium]
MMKKVLHAITKKGFAYDDDNCHRWKTPARKHPCEGFYLLFFSFWLILIAIEGAKDMRYISSRGNYPEVGI